jgi:hypothetical protein
MIGTQTTGRIAGVIISAVAHEGLSVSIDGKPARLAIIDDAGNIVAAGPDVAREAEAVSINIYREMWQARGHLRVMSKPIQTVGATPK